jgi:hypothetical protein
VTGTQAGDVTEAYLLGFGITGGCSNPGMWKCMAERQFRSPERWDLKRSVLNPSK